MQEEARKAISFLIADNIRRIKDPAPKEALKQDPAILAQYVASSVLRTAPLVRRLRVQHEALLPFVKQLRTHVTDIAEHTHICAVYLIACRMFDTLMTVTDLITDGRSPSVGSLLRDVEEDTMLIETFMIESFNSGHSLRDKWFAGGIVTHGEGREVADRFHKMYPVADNVDLKKLSNHIYQMQSQGVHPTYISMLELISPFTEDYDFSDRTQRYRSIAYARFACQKMTAVNISLKGIFGLMLRDDAAYQKLNELLLKFEPGANGPVREESVKDFLRQPSGPSVSPPTQASSAPAPATHAPDSTPLATPPADPPSHS